MEYITVKQFLEQPKEVQQYLLKWWKENITQYDLFYRRMKHNFIERQKYIIINVNKYDITTLELRCNNKETDYLSYQSNVDYWDIETIDDIIPLFVETQLRNFIEDKLQDKITDLEYCINPKNDCTPQYKIENINSNEQNLLQAYWKVACKIIEEVIGIEGND